MALRTFLVSLVLHAGVAASVVAGGSGHAVGRAAAPQPLDVVEVDAVTESVDVIAPPAPEPDEDVARNAASAPAPTHRHPYAVPAGHDARPHDPAMPHDHPGAGEHPHAAGEAPPALTSDAPARPVFAMSSGNGSIAAGSTRVAAEARGAGGGAAPEEAGAGTTYAASAVSVPAKLVAAARAAYPSGARADDVEGDVALEIVVDAGGTVVDARVARRAGHGFDESALAAIRAYRFSPAEREGRRVRVRMPWTVQFRLR